MDSLELLGIMLKFTDNNCIRAMSLSFHLHQNSPAVVVVAFLNLKQITLRFFKFADVRDLRSSWYYVRYL